MKKFVKTACYLLILVALVTLALAPATAHASPPTEITGTFIVDSISILEVKPAGGNLIVKQIEYGHLTGDVIGPFSFERTVIVHSNGEVSVHGIITSGPVTILGRPGTYVQNVNARVVDGAIQGRWTNLSGTGDLANAHGQGIFAGIAGVSGTYSGQIHFDPK